MKIALVLGGGGMVGMAYHAGVLRALEVEGGFAPQSADVIVGTSAGSVVGAYLRAGWTTEDFWQLALGTHPTLAPLGAGESTRRPDIFVPTFRTPIDIMRRSMGSMFVLARSVLPWPMPMPGVLRQLFPGGLFTMDEGQRRFEEELPEAWPEQPLWLTAVDIVRGRRVVLGRAGAPAVSLRRAVLASCAIPGLYQPVQAGRMTLVDGGAFSTTNLDLGVRFGADVIIGVAPLAFETSTPPGPLGQLARRVPARALSHEVAHARRRGIDVVMIRPSARELRVHGLNLMRPTGLEHVAQAAYEETTTLLATDRFQSIFTRLPA